MAAWVRVQSPFGSNKSEEELEALKKQAAQLSPRALRKRAMQRRLAARKKQTVVSTKARSNKKKQAG